MGQKGSGGTAGSPGGAVVSLVGTAVSRGCRAAPRLSLCSPRRCGAVGGGPTNLSPSRDKGADRGRARTGAGELAGGDGPRGRGAAAAAPGPRGGGAVAGGRAAGGTGLRTAPRGAPTVRGCRLGPPAQPRQPGARRDNPPLGVTPQPPAPPCCLGSELGVLGAQRPSSRQLCRGMRLRHAGGAAPGPPAVGLPRAAAT